MNKLVIFFCAALTGSSFAQQTAVRPDSSERPTKPFSNLVPEKSSWVVTVKKPWELRPVKAEAPARDPAEIAAEQAYLAQFASTAIKRIENAYASGVRQEIIHYEDGSKLTRYVTPGQLLYEDRKTGEAVLDDPASGSTGPTWGVNRLAELDWVADKYYIGVANYKGRTCYVYRQFAPNVVVAQQAPDPNAEPQEAPPGATASEIKNSKNAKILATAFIDKETMQPVAYVTMYEVWLYEKSDSFQAFAIPSSLQEVAHKEAEAVEKMKQKYNIRQ